jgi:hypothetical protein
LNAVEELAHYHEWAQDLLKQFDWPAYSCPYADSMKAAVDSARRSLDSARKLLIDAPEARDAMGYLNSALYDIDHAYDYGNRVREINAELRDLLTTIEDLVKDLARLKVEDNA